MPLCHSAWKELDAEGKEIVQCVHICFVLDKVILQLQASGGVCVMTNSPIFVEECTDFER